MKICSICRTGPLKETEIGYCNPCELDVSAAIDAAFEKLMPLVVREGEASDVARTLWLAGWRVAPADQARLPRCRSCTRDVDLVLAFAELEAAIDVITDARAEDAERVRRRVVQPLPLELKRWIALCARVFRHVFSASLLLTCCPACVQKAKENAPRIIGG